MRIIELSQDEEDTILNGDIVIQDLGDFAIKIELYMDEERILDEMGNDVTTSPSFEPDFELSK